MRRKHCGCAARTPGTAENVEAVTIEIERVKGLAATDGRSARRRGTRTAASERRSWQDAPRNPARNKGRRTMGRAGGR